jgi:hypothetical protein
MSPAPVNPDFALLTLPAVLVAFIVHFAIGSIWYSHYLFGNGFARYALGKAKPQVPDPRAMAAAAVGSLMQSPFICFYLSAVGVRNANQGCVFGLTLGFFDCCLHLSHGAFEKRPVQLYVIHQGYHVISLLATCAILGALFGQ